MEEIKRQLEKLGDKLEKMDSRLDSIDVTLVKHQVSLEQHMHRSELLEDRTDVLFAELEPIKSHINRVDGAFRFVGLISTISGILAVIWKILHP